MGWKDVPPPKPTPPGEWEAFNAGNYRGWILRCGAAFNAHVHVDADKFYTRFNNEGRPIQGTLSRAQAAVEEEIINSVRAMLPAYRVIFERVERRAKIQPHSNVTLIHGPRE